MNASDNLKTHNIYDPLFFFDKLIIKDGASILYQEFIPSEDEELYTEVQFDPIKRTKTHISFNREDGSPEEPYVEDYLNAFFKKRLFTEIQDVRTSINLYCLSHTTDEQKGYLKEVYRQTKYLINRTLIKLNSPDSLICKGYLENLFNYLNEVYFPQNKDGLNLFKTFGFKDNFYQSKIFDTIYNSLNLLNPNGFISIEKTTEMEFKQLMTSKDLSDEVGKIFLTCDNAQAAYILKKLKPFFKTLSFANIGRSKLFINPNEKALNANDLSKSIAIAEQPKDFLRINKVFDELLRTKNSKIITYSYHSYLLLFFSYQI